MGVVFHGSSVQNLTEIKPLYHRPVFAAKDKVIAALFMVNRNAGQYTYSRTIGHIHKDKAIPFITERYKDAFDELYSDVSGSIYVLDDKSFCAHGSSFMISNYSVPVLQEIKIPDIKQYLLDLSENNQLKIYKYPTRPSSIPDDDSDLVQQCIQFVKFNQIDKLQEFKKRFPDLYQKNKDKFEKEAKQ